MSKSISAGSKKVEKAVHEMKESTLKTDTGTQVNSRKQAIAIGLLEARVSGEKVSPQKARSISSKKSHTKK